MGQVFWLTCPACGFRYYVGRELLEAKTVPSVCPRCHHEYPPEHSATGIEATTSG
ncbi:MAG: hypothetical protein K6U87_00800 [Firmicutes bacterium]|nr:hypothetical protein [Bacillota bacterium]